MADSPRQAGTETEIGITREMIEAGYARWLDLLREESANGLPIADSDCSRLLQEVCQPLRCPTHRLGG